MFGQVSVHEAPDVLQCPAIVGQFKGPVQAVVGDAEHVPGRVGHSAGSMPVTWHTAALLIMPVLLLMQWPALPQGGPAGLHALASIEQVSPAVGQVVVQTALVRLQCEERTQALLS